MSTQRDRLWKDASSNVTGREILIEELGISEASRVLLALGRKGWGLWPIQDRRLILDAHIAADRLEKHGNLIRHAASVLAEGRSGEPTELSEAILEIPIRPPKKTAAQWRERCAVDEGGLLSE